MDLFRNPPSQVLLELLGTEPPLLYNRHSCQTYHVPIPKTTHSKDSSERKAEPVDYDQVRAWAKGRQVTSPKIRPPKVKSPVMIPKEDNSMDQDELLLEQQQQQQEELTMTPLQRKGKQAIQERTKAQANNNKK
jgi:hypothetical protein